MTDFCALSLRDYYSLPPQEKIAHYQKTQKRALTYLTIAGSFTLGIGALLYLKKIRPLTGGLFAIPSLTAFGTSWVIYKWHDNDIVLEKAAEAALLKTPRRRYLQKMADDVKRAEAFLGSEAVQLLQQYLRQELPNLNPQKNERAQYLEVRAAVQVEFCTGRLQKKVRYSLNQIVQFFHYNKMLFALRALRDDSKNSGCPAYNKVKSQLTVKGILTPLSFAQSVLGELA